MVRLCIIAVVVGLLTATESQAGFFVISSIAQQSNASTFHNTNAAGGANGNLKAGISLNTGTSTWDSVTGEFVIQINVHSGWSSSTGLAGFGEVGVATGTGNLKFDNSGLAGHIDWSFTLDDLTSNSIRQSLEAMGAMTAAEKTATVRMYYHEYDSHLIGSAPPTGIFLWGSDAVTETNKRGGNHTGLGSDLRLNLTPSESPGSNPVPEPASILLIGIGCASLGGFGWRRRRRDLRTRSAN